MKKLLATLLCLVVLMTGAAAFAEESGIWSMRAYNDDNGNPTDESYIISTEITGAYCDEETIGGALSAYVYCEKSDGEFYISFRLIEDGTIVENAGDETRYYDVAMLDNYGELYEFEGTMSAGNRDVYFFADGESTELIRALNRDGSLRFALTDASNPMVRYDFALEDTTGFADLVKAMGY